MITGIACVHRRIRKRDAAVSLALPGGVARPSPVIQRSVVTAAELRQLGTSLDVADRQVRGGRWQRAARGIYLTHARSATDAELVAVARAYSGRDAVITGALVLRQLGLRWVPPYAQVHVLVRPEVSGMSSGLVEVTRTNDVGQLETWTRYGGSLACAERAVIDTARGLPTLADVRGVVLGAVADRWADPAALRAILDAGQRNGSALTRRAIGDAERGCASPPEAELVDALVGRGVRFYVNPELWLDGVLIGCPDVWLVDRGVGGEIESRERHETDVRLVESTYDRHERFAAACLELVHLSVRRVRRNAVETADHLLARVPLRPPPDRLVIRPRGPLLR